MPDVLSKEDDPLSPGYTEPASTPSESTELKAQRAKQERDEANAKRAEQFTERSIELTKKSLETTERGIAAQEPMRQAVIKASDDVSAASKNRPKLEQVPKAPEKPGPDETWLSTAGLIGAIAGAFTRNHATNALGAFTGVINGFQERDEDKFRSNLKTWEAESKRLNEVNKQRLEAYQDILSDAKLTQEQKMTNLHIEAERWKDQATAQMAAAKAYGQMGDSLTAQMAQQERIEMARERLDLTSKRYLGEIDKKKLDDFAKGPGQTEAGMIARGELPIPSSNPRTGFAGMKADWLIEESKKINPGLSANDFAENRAARTAAGRVAGTRGQNLTLIIQNASALIPEAARLASQVDNTQFKRLNWLINHAKEEMGDPTVKRFAVINQALAELHARSLNPNSSQITNQAYNTAAEIISTNSSPTAYMAMLEEFRTTYQRDYDAIKRVAAHEPLPDIVIPSALPTPVGEAGRKLGEMAGGAAKYNFPGYYNEKGQPVDARGRTKEEAGSVWSAFKEWVTGNGGSITPVEKK